MCVEITFEQEDSSSGLGRERADGGVGCPFDGLYAPLETSTGRVGSFFRLGWRRRICGRLEFPSLATGLCL